MDKMDKKKLIYYIFNIRSYEENMIINFKDMFF
jgi:hypothetical protein